METTRSFPMGMNYEQGLGFAENTGYWPMPEARTGVIKITDNNDLQHCLVLDFTDGKFYDITTRDTPDGFGIQRAYKDKMNVAFSGGYDIAPEITFKEDTSQSEKYVTEVLSNRFYVRPYRESNRNASGYDSRGFLDDVAFSASVYVDGEPTTDSATAADISKWGEVVYDRKVEGHRIQHKFSADKGDWQLVGRQQTYITKDINYEITEAITTEGDYQDNVSSPVFWATRGSDSDIVNGATFTVGHTTGPDLRTDSAYSSSSAITISGVPSGTKYVMMWGSGISGVTIGGTAVTLSTYSASGSWTLYYASGISSSGAFVVTPSGTAGVYDIRMLSSALTSADLAYYFGDVTENGADNVCPLF